jgi:hypothetical protein
MIESYRDLVAWQKGMELVHSIYQVSKQFPKAEVETQIQIAHSLKYMEGSAAANLLNLCAELGRIINGLLSSMKNK